MAEEATKKTVIFHKDCPDGLCAAWVAWKTLGTGADYLPMHYDTQVPGDQWFAGRDVYLVDFSWPLATLERLQRIASSVTVLDHHRSAAENLAGTSFEKHIRQDWSGAHIAWDYFHRSAPRSLWTHPGPPWIVQYVEDNDLWHHKLANWEAVRVIVEAVDLRAADVFERWDDLYQRMEQDLDAVVREGRVAATFREAMIARLARDPSHTVLDGQRVPCVNASLWQSEIGDVLDKGAPFAVVWRMIKDGSYAYSLRSDKETGVDVSAIARKYGGGGHMHAAGFTSNAPPMIVP